ncbi:MAG: AAA15 family ATPase/GTPase [Phenylobacterium sp.]|jgi:AAA15 family ATPase/GTPase
MLIEFSVENFKVFKNKATLSMVAHKPYKEHPESTYVHENFADILFSKSAVIYGANGSGKSSLIEGLTFLNAYIAQGFITQEQDANHQPFLFDQTSINAPTHFEIIFIGNDNVKYHYGLSFNADRVIAEFLLSFVKKGVRAKTLFSRVYDEQTNNNQYYHPGLIENKRTIEIVVDKVNDSPKTSFLAALNQYEAKQIKPVIHWLQLSLLTVPFNVNSEFTNFTKSNLIERILDKNKGDNHKKEIIKLLNNFDLSINDIQIIKRDLVLPDNLSPEVKSRLQAEMGHDIQVIHKTLSGKSYPIKYEHLSSGTKKLLDLSDFLYLCITTCEYENTVLVFDEFEASFHPHIVKKLYEMLVRVPSGKMQLIVTTHSPTLLDPELIRRDQVWFVEKNAELESELYSLVDFSPTVNDSIAKGWMQGRYGAVPYIEWE